MLVRGVLLGADLLMQMQLSAGESVADAYESRTVTVTERGEPVEFRYRLLRPATIEPATTYPVVLFLHGAGERGNDNERQLQYFPTWMAEPSLRSRHPCFLVAPQCREERGWSGFDWQTMKAAALPEAPTTDAATCDARPVRPASGSSKFDLTRAALTQVVASLRDADRAGLAVFGSDDACGVSSSPLVSVAALTSFQTTSSSYVIFSSLIQAVATRTASIHWTRV
jgi:hypothetical protein